MVARARTPQHATFNDPTVSCTNLVSAPFHLGKSSTKFVYALLQGSFHFIHRRRQDSSFDFARLQMQDNDRALCDISRGRHFRKHSQCPALFGLLNAGDSFITKTSFLYRIILLPSLARPMFSRISSILRQSAFCASLVQPQQ